MNPPDCFSSLLKKHSPPFGVFLITDLMLKFTSQRVKIKGNYGLLSGGAGGVFSLGCEGIPSGGPMGKSSMGKVGI